MSKELTRQEGSGQFASFKTLLQKFKPQIGEMLPRHLTPERMMRIATMAASRDSGLLRAEPMSVIASIVQASRMGIEPDGTFNSGWLIARWNSKTQRNECTFQIGYGGKIDLQMRSGKYEEITARAIHKNDKFKMSFTPSLKFFHEPLLDGDRGPLIAVYCVTVTKTGHHIVDFMTRAECEKVRDDFGPRNKAGNIVGPWVSDFEAMCLKTVIHQASKTKDKSVEYRNFQTEEDRIEQGESAAEVVLGLDLSELGAGGSDMETATTTKTEELREKLTDKKNQVDTRESDPPKQEDPKKPKDEVNPNWSGRADDSPRREQEAPKTEPKGDAGPKPVDKSEPPRSQSQKLGWDD